ncbi:hypothetical protein RGQ15_22110 [Paracoccus sp. MBLB3053]|uniref:Uncharacterized protein n=1 Tax=Paracoccus aurantius TaxID=3073814 RepID=A0ABU2I057_9RHOB|nr:hypothetical protein [Paracoccus sp. MBLB3053]MDS9470244.1 hypothetical protein [Paracoccus sp. MBLB3053]
MTLAAVISLPVWQAQGQDPAQQQGSTTENPFAALDHLADEATPNFGASDQAAGRDQDFLRLSPKSETQDVPKALTENLPYSSCDKLPVVESAAFKAASPDAYARRMFYVYAQMRRVLDTGDCTCKGKTAPFAAVEAIEAELQSTEGVDWNRHAAGRDYISRARKLRADVEAMCGGTF